MADRALRGMRLGTQSMETPGHAELALTLLRRHAGVRALFTRRTESEAP